MKSAASCPTSASPALQDTDTGRIAIYYGAADSVVGLAFTEVNEVVSYIKEHSKVSSTDTEIGIK